MLFKVNGNVAVDTAVTSLLKMNGNVFAVVAAATSSLLKVNGNITIHLNVDVTFVSAVTSLFKVNN